MHAQCTCIHTHTGLAGRGARGNIHTDWPCWPGCKGEHTHTLALLAGVQGGTYTHTGLAGLDVRGNIHTHRPCWPGCKGEHTHTQAGVQGGTREYQEDNKNWSKRVYSMSKNVENVSLKKGDVMLSVASFIRYFLKWHP